MTDLANRITTWVRRRPGARRVGVPVALALGIAAGVALGPGFGAGQPVTEPPLALTAALTPYSSCDQLVADLTRRALPMVGPTGFDGGGPVGRGLGHRLILAGTQPSPDVHLALAGRRAATGNFPSDDAVDDEGKP